jgi:hypothetical protein
MNRLMLWAVAALFPAILGSGSCQPKPCAPGCSADSGVCVCPPSPATGGVASTGGSPATGGAKPIDPLPLATGGTVTAAVVFPECLDVLGFKVSPVVWDAHLLGWHPPKPNDKLKATPEAFDLTRLKAGIKTFWDPTDLVNLDQGQVGSCAPNGANQCLATIRWGRRSSESEALDWYHLATVADGLDGVYPPDDTGTTLEAVWGVVLGKKLVKGIRRCSTVPELRAALLDSPGEIGTQWDGGMFNVSCDGKVIPDGNSQGGHGYAVVGDDLESIYFRNSWKAWGAKRKGPKGIETGYFKMSYADVSALAARGWECIFPR